MFTTNTFELGEFTFWHNYLSIGKMYWQLMSENRLFQIKFLLKNFVFFLLFYCLHSSKILIFSSRNLLFACILCNNPVYENGEDKTFIRCLDASGTRFFFNAIRDCLKIVPFLQTWQCQLKNLLNFQSQVLSRNITHFLSVGCPSWGKIKMYPVKNLPTKSSRPKAS